MMLVTKSPLCNLPKTGTDKILALDPIFLYQAGAYNLLLQQLPDKNKGHLVFPLGILHFCNF